MTKIVKRVYHRPEPDSAFMLKLVLYLIIGFQWVRLVNPELTKEIPLPVGLVIGLFFTAHERFRIDRKLEYAVLLISMLIGFWSQTGIYLNVLE